MPEPIDPTLAEVVPGNEPAEAVENATESVIPATGEAEEAPVIEPKVPENSVPLARLNEVIEERNALRETTSALSRQVETLTTMVSKAQDGGKVTAKEQDKAQDALDSLITAGEITREEATKLQRIVDAMGYEKKRPANEEDPRIKQLEGTVKQLQQKHYEDADASELSSTLKKYEGIVDQGKVQEKMKEFARSGDSELVRLAREGSYEDIIRKGFFSEIVQAEAAKLTKGKPPVAPKIEPSKNTAVKTPAPAEILYDPSDPKAYDRAVRAAILAKVREKAE